MNLDTLLQRREPILYIASHEESRVETEIQRYCDHVDSGSYFRWSHTLGLQRLENGVMKKVNVPQQQDADPRLSQLAPLPSVLQYLLGDSSIEGIVLLKDIHPFLQQSGNNYNPAVSLTIRALRDAFYEIRSQGRLLKLVLVSPESNIPDDLQNEIRICDFPLPRKDDLKRLVRQWLQRARAIARQDHNFMVEVQDDETFCNEMANAALGLTEVEVEYILQNMIYVDRSMDLRSSHAMMQEKRQIVRKSGVLEYIPVDELGDLRVGGVETMLEWLRRRQEVFLNAETFQKQYGIISPPKGVLLLGIPGCGKSLTCKRIARNWSLPLLRLDLGAIFNRYVGASEERLRSALRMAESISPCILWIDEIEKGFSVGAGGDGGTGARVLGAFLVWMQENKSPVFVAATANDISALPPEMLRARRFDNRFFVGCPGESARRDILTIHLEQRRLDPAQFDLQMLVDKSYGYTGAEIEQAIEDSVYDAGFEKRSVRQEDMTSNMERTRPLVKSLGPQLEKVFQMLDDGRMEMASNDTLRLDDLSDRLHF